MFYCVEFVTNYKILYGKLFEENSNRTTFTALDALSKIVIYKNSLQLQKQKYAFAKG